MIKFSNKFIDYNIETTSMLFKINKQQKIPFNLIKEIIENNINKKTNYTKF